MNIHVRFGLFVVATVLAATSAYSATTSRLEGRVVDEQNQALPDVQLTISSAGLIGGPQTAISGHEGGFAFNLLPVGEYSVTAEKAGYQPATADVPVRLDRTAYAMLRLVAVAFSGEIVVGAEVPIVDVTRTSIGEVYSEEYLRQATIGSVGRRLFGIEEQVAGVASSGQTFGATYADNNYLVDGYNITDPSSGSSITHFVYDAVEEASVLTGGIDAEFGFGTGYVMNVVTKSGGNQFSGTFDARYRDQDFNESGKYFDPDDNVSSSRILSATLGGPIQRDKLWFFVAFENEYKENTPVGAPETQLMDRNYYLGKLTWAINNANRMSLKLSATPGTTEYYGASNDRTSDATSLVKRDEPAALLDFSSVLTDSLLLTAGLGFGREELSSMPMINDLETPSEYDRNANLRFSNPGFVEESDRDRDHLWAKLSKFVGDALGDHQFDGGLEYHKLRSSEINFWPGGYRLEYLNNDYWEDDPWPDGDGDGLVDIYLDRLVPAETVRDPIESEGKGWSAYIQDQWRPRPQLTVNFGLRYDTMEHTNTVGQTVADFQKWLPRFGAAWDLRGDGRQVVRIGWGRYMHPGVTSLAGLVPGIRRGTEYYYGLDYLCRYGICDRETAAAVIGSEFVHVDADGDEHPYYLSFVGSARPSETVDTLGVGRLRVPYRDELMLAYEARVAEQTSLELTYVKKDFHDGIEDTCNNNTWAWGDGDPPSLDDPSTWTDLAGCTGSVRANIPGLERGYEALILRAASRARSWFHLVGSYTYSKTRGNNPYSNPHTGFGTSWGGFPNLPYDQFPSNVVNLDGAMGDDFRHHVKLNGYLELPLDFTIGVGAYYRSAGALSVYTHCFNMHSPSSSGLAELERLGIDYEEMSQYCQNPASGYLFLEPFGSRRGSDEWQIDLQLNKGFQVGDARLVGIVSVFNLFSEEAPVAFTEDPFDSRGWGAETNWQNPRRWELGFRVEF